MKTPRILIVEDDEMMGSLLAAVLTRSGYAVSQVHSASAMAEQITKQSFAAVILDLSLPEEDRLVLARKLRSTSQVPILVFSARQELDDRLVAPDLGLDDYLIKPCEPEEIVLRARNLLRRSGERGAEPQTALHSATTFSMSNPG
jgi:DNA-binding response OmpR family regulator